MMAYMLVGILLIAAGIFGLVYTQFSFTKNTHEANLGPIEMKVKGGKQTINIPAWAGVASIVVGAVMLLMAF